MDPQKFKSEMYARQLVTHAFEVVELDGIEQNAQARHVYERLKADLERVFNEELPMTNRCWGCGKMRNEPTEELIGYQMLDGLREAYKRQASQLDPQTRALCEQLAGANRLDLIAVCAEFMLKHTVRGFES
jgi:hypothetical protein